MGFLSWLRFCLIFQILIAFDFNFSVHFGEEKTIVIIFDDCIIVNMSLLQGKHYD
jgi:hypothetical protein